MGSPNPCSVPVINFSGGGLTPGSHTWAATRAEVRAALDLWGCFEAVYGGIAPELREATFAAAEELFALPLEAKLRNVSDKVNRGYVGPSADLRCRPSADFPLESLTVDDVLRPAAARDFTDLMWAQGNPRFCETISKFAEKVAELDGMIRRMVLESLGVDKYCDSHMESTKYQLRLSEYYPPGSGKEARLTLGPHVDANMCTLVYQNSVHGLDVQARSGEWIPAVPSSPNSFIFLAGDAFRAWSNDRLFSAPHRVSVAGGEARRSILLFAIPRDEAVIEAPGELVDEGHPRRFEPYRYQDYLEYSSRALEHVADVTSILPDFLRTAGQPRQEKPNPTSAE